MAFVVAVASQKGGAGKSTVAANLATALLAEGVPVALLDTDPQGTLSRWHQERPEDAPALDFDAPAGWRVSQMVEKRLPQRFWKSGPERVQASFAALLRRRIETGDLDIDDADVDTAAAQFFVLLKGDLHQRMVFDCDGAGDCAAQRRAHLEASVTMFLRAYGRDRSGR